MKRYLTGIDWVINSIDYSGKSRFGVGNVSQIILELQGEPDGTMLRRSLCDFLRDFPLVNGLPSRGLNLCPYWKVPPPAKYPPPA